MTTATLGAILPDVMSKIAKIEKFSHLESKNPTPTPTSTPEIMKVGKLVSQMDLTPGACDIYIAEAPQIFDPVSKIILTDPIFRNTIDNWGYGHKNLWKQTSVLGVDRVKTTIKHVQKMSGLRSRGAYLRKMLDNMINNRSDCKSLA